VQFLSDFGNKKSLLSLTMIRRDNWDKIYHIALTPVSRVSIK